LSLYQKLQEDVTKAHVEYQTLSEKSHLAYLEEARTALDDIRMIAMGGFANAHESVTHNENGHTRTRLAESVQTIDSLSNKVNGIATTEQITPAQATNLAPAALLKIDSPVAIPAPVQKMPPPPPVVTAPAAPVTAPAPAVSTPAPFTQPIVSSQVSLDIDPAIQAIILAIAADKTGYPEDTLSMDMDLEADLGIDSIKRVEILSAMQEQIPNLPELNPAELTGLHTFREIAVFVKKQQGV
jgi:acyl carrier protein